MAGNQGVESTWLQRDQVEGSEGKEESFESYHNNEKNKCEIIMEMIVYH